MMDFGKYAWFIWMSYAVFALLIGGIVLATLVSAARTRRQLESLTDEQGRPKP
jgi:heme exporter protein CcmD